MKKIFYLIGLSVFLPLFLFSLSLLFGISSRQYHIRILTSFLQDQTKPKPKQSQEDGRLVYYNKQLIKHMVIYLNLLLFFFSVLLRRNKGLNLTNVMRVRENRSQSEGHLNQSDYFHKFFYRKMWQNWLADNQSICNFYSPFQSCFLLAHAL